MPAKTNPVFNQQQLLRPKAAAALLGVSANTLWRWARTRPEFPRVVRIGPGASAWRLADLEVFIAGRR